MATEKGNATITRRAGEGREGAMKWVEYMPQN